MSESTAKLIVLSFFIYVLIGVLYSVYFFSIQAPKKDPVFKNASWTVKFLMIPGAVFLWPLVALGGRSHD